VWWGERRAAPRMYTYIAIDRRGRKRGRYETKHIRPR
jgi:hypothetical protein